MIFRRPPHAPALLAWLFLAGSARAAAPLTVGPGKMYPAPCAAIAAAHDGDTIEIDAKGTYDGDVCSVPKNGLTLRGVGGRAKIDAAKKNYGGKGTWVISGNDTIVENIEFSGATVVDQNGAGIRQEGKNLTIRGCYFHDNDDGILTGGSADSQILIEYTEFANNGFGDGYSHNMYIGHEGRFTLRYSYSHDSKIGHLVKSRAAENYILYNRITGEKGTSSYEIDMPNGGVAYVIGNLIEQGPQTDNSGMVTYGLEGTVAQNPGRELFVVNNTFLNDRTGGGTFVTVGAMFTTPAVIKNNIFSGPGTITNQGGAVVMTNFSGGDPMLVNPATFDFHLKPGSPCIDKGSDPGMGAGFALTPTWQYVHPTSAQGRMSVGIIDIGAYEVGGATDAGPDGAIVGGGAGGAGGAGGRAGVPDASVGAAGNAVGAGGGAGAGVGAGAGGSAGAGVGGAASVGVGGGVGAGTGGSGIASAPSAGDEGGCGCRMGATAHTKVWLALLVSLGSTAGFRARRRASTKTKERRS